MTLLSAIASRGSDPELVHKKRREARRPPVAKPADPDLPA
jgi:hypothetical protein